ncbi:MAG TPA: hypothetical protein DCG88_07155 [Sphingobacterium sp.]|nr:hypothetical protein [Sphingobacterium sp.]
MRLSSSSAFSKQAYITGEVLVDCANCHPMRFQSGNQASGAVLFP